MFLFFDNYQIQGKRPQTQEKEKEDGKVDAKPSPTSTLEDQDSPTRHDQDAPTFDDQDLPTFENQEVSL